MASRVKHRTTGPPRLSKTEIAAAQARWRDTLPRALPELAGAADALLARISPPNWALEWSLPGWLGDALDIPATRSFDLVVGNVYGLAYVRLHDDLVDGEAPSEERLGTHLLATTLFHQWLATYIRLFGGAPAFWEHFERYLDQWQRATLAGERHPDMLQQAFGRADFLPLAHRGAPLKICAAGACLLAERQDLLPQLEALLDELLTGAVLLDHALDWGSDLAAGRWNAFVAHISPQPQILALREANRLAVLDDLAAGKAARPYFALIRERLQAAASDAQALGLVRLTDYVFWLRGQADLYGKRLAQAARRQLRAAVVELFAVPDTTVEGEL